MQTFDANAGQIQAHLLRRGQLAWLTRGRFLGHERTYLPLQVDDVLLPNHGWNAASQSIDVTRGAMIRMTADDAHHAARCRAILQACARAPHSVVDLVPVVFGRVIEDPHQMSFAFGEALAHANYLVRRNELRIAKTAAGTYLEAIAAPSGGP